MLRTLRRQGWGPSDVVVGAVLVAATIAVTWPVWADIATIATRDEEASHILLVPPIAFWLAWLRRLRLRQCRPKARWAGPLATAAGLLASSWGWVHGVDAAWHGGALIAVIGAFVSVAGVQPLVRFAPAFLVLAFMIPVPGTIRQAVSLPLQSASARLTQFVLELSGMFTERSGNLIVVDGMPIAVAEACNGMRMAFALLLVMHAFAFSIPMRNSVRLLLLLASPVVAIVANVIRLVPTVFTYARFDTETGDAVHAASGWVMLIVAFVALLGIEQILRWALIPTQRFTLAQRAA